MIIKRFLYTAIGYFWLLLCFRQAISFRKAIFHVEDTQRKLLLKILKRNKKTIFGEKYGFSSMSDISDFKLKVPILDYDDYIPYIESILKRENNVLTKDKVLLLEPSSGSSAPSKYIPYTKGLQKDFRRAIAAWVCDIFTKRKEILKGRAYWSITPINQEVKITENGMKIGFNEDAEYFGFIERHLLKFILVVPKEINQIDDIITFRYVTLLFLMKEKNLTFISIWNPTFLTLLLEPLMEWTNSLVNDIENGTITPPGRISPGLKEKLMKRFSRDVLRARELRYILESWRYRDSIRPARFSLCEHIWPYLTLISCWTDANASRYVKKLKDTFPNVEIQPKGLIATEGFISFPVIGEEGSVLSINSHFFEFKEVDDTETKLSHQLELGKLYSVIITTSGGLYRYDLQDIVEIVGFIKGCPLVRFVGKEDKISDLFGEKLNEYHVSYILKELFEKYNISPTFFIMAPEQSLEDNQYFYTIFLQLNKNDEKSEVVLSSLIQEIEERLQGNYHYKYCRSMGQLSKLRIFLISPGTNPLETYLNICQDYGQKLGNIKPAIIHSMTGWSKIFQGSFLDANSLVCQINL